MCRAIIALPCSTQALRARVARVAHVAGLAALVLNLGAGLPAQAGDLVANASQNPVGQISNSSPGGSVSAAWPDTVSPIAQALSTRTAISASSLGANTQMPVHQAANGTARTDYLLWDLGTGVALDAGIAAGLTLAFNFRVTGVVDVPPVSLSTGGANFDATLYSQIIDGRAAGVSVVYGPMPPFPSTGYLVNGDSSLLGAYDLGFSLLHVGRVSGLWTMGLGTAASNASTASGLLQLVSVTVQDGVAPAGLAIRLETDELIAVAVPELPAWLLMLAGGSWLAGFARRHQR